MRARAVVRASDVRCVCANVEERETPADRALHGGLRGRLGPCRCGRGSAGARADCVCGRGRGAAPFFGGAASMRRCSSLACITCLRVRVRVRKRVGRGFG